jgi:ATP-binding cassette subfamily F protein 3
MGEIVKSKDYNVGFLRQQLALVEDKDGARVARPYKGGWYPPLQENQLAEDNNGAREARPYDANSFTAYQYLLSAFEKLLEMERKIEKITEELSENYDEKKTNELNILIDTYNFEGGNTYIKELKTGFKKFGFTESDLEKDMNKFSGGQATKISLLKLLLSRPDVLLLDEPTNHLDIEAIEWMENYLKNYKKNVVIVSHDRMFLDNICNVIYDVENKLTERYDGNYTDFVEQKEINYELKLAEYNKNVKEIERLTKLADRFRYKATKAKMVQSKDKVIEKLEAKTFKPLESDMKNFHVKIVPRVAGGREVLRCNNLVVGYDGARIAREGDAARTARGDEAHAVRGDEVRIAIATINVTVNRQDRLAVLGANGTGKSTFIKTIVGVIPKISGEYEYGHEIEYEYFDQKIAENNSTKTVFEDFSDEFPTYTNTEVRNRLGRFLFGEEDINKRVCDLSGGEKVRLCLSKIFERKPNLLILDEPTNHLDILGKESLEEILNSFEGTVIFVSHDRYFVKKIANKVLYFEKNSRAKFFEFGYEDYEKYISGKEVDDEGARTVRDGDAAHIAPQECFVALHSLHSLRKRSGVLGDVGADIIRPSVSGDAAHIVRGDEARVDENIEAKQPETTTNKESYEANKQKNKNQKKAKKLEEEIEILENEIDELNKKLLDETIQSDFEKLTDINIEIKKLSDILEEKYSEWDTLA